MEVWTDAGHPPAIMAMALITLGLRALQAGGRELRAARVGRATLILPARRK
jgi:hypothetical protein